MPRGRPKSIAGISKLEGVRRALAGLEHDAKPQAIQAHLKKEFGIKMELAMISSYKSLIRSQGNKSPIVRRSAATTSPASFSLADIQAVKEIADRIGPDRVRQLADVL